MTPALAGRFLSTAPPGKSKGCVLDTLSFFFFFKAGSKRIHGLMFFLGAENGVRVCVYFLGAGLGGEVLFSLNFSACAVTLFNNHTFAFLLYNK